jgi:surface antigen
VSLFLFISDRRPPKADFLLLQGVKAQQDQQIQELQQQRQQLLNEDTKNKQQIEDLKSKVVLQSAQTKKASPQANSHGKTTMSGSEFGDVVYLYADRTNNCVQFAKDQTGINHPMGSGGRSSIQGHDPRVGAIGSLKGAPHAVVVTAIHGDQITIKESNYRRNAITQRTLPKSMFLGYIYN